MLSSKSKFEFKTSSLVALYLGAVVAANLAVARFGPAAMPVTAFLLIPFDLTARDLLHEAWGGRGLIPKMAALVAAGSALSYLITPSSGRVALASAASFAAAGVADALAYQLLGGWGRRERMILSNVCSSVVDSVAFPVLAFGATTFWLSAGQAGTKIAGGYLWTLLFVRLFSRRQEDKMFRITKQFSFDAAHYLRGLPAGHKCANLHGHTYRVEVVLEAAALDERGFVVDYKDLGLLRTFIDTTLDHQCLNDVGGELGVPELQQPTAENISAFLFRWCSQRWPQTTMVRVSETPNTWAEYREGA